MDDKRPSVQMDVVDHDREILADDPSSFELDDEFDEEKTRQRGSYLSWRSHTRGLRSMVSLPDRSQIIARCRAFAIFLIPSFIHSRIWPSQKPPKPLHPTAYLDGIRGVAAFVVYICHMAYSSHDLGYGYGYVGKTNDFNDDHRSLWRLPIIRLIYDGDPMVAFFFVVSGYALSYKPVKQFRSKDFSGAFTTMTSGTFRRGIRLFLPCAIAMLFTATIVQLGAYNPTRKIATSKTLLTGYREFHSPQRATYFHQLYYWAHETWIMINPFHWDGIELHVFPGLDMHLWTIPVEFGASLLLFVAQLGTARLKPWIRQLVVSALIIFAMTKDSWPMMLFYAGFLFAELELGRQENASLSLPTKDGRSASSRRSGAFRGDIASLFWLLSFFVGLFFMSQPFESENTFFWQSLSKLIPEQFSDSRRFYTNIGAIIVAYVVSRKDFLKRIFDNRVSQYLGKISFSLYFTHTWVIHTLAYRLFDIVWSAWGNETWAAKEGGWFLVLILTTPIQIFVADVFWRGVDDPCVRFAKWFEGKCIVQIK